MYQSRLGLPPKFANRAMLSIDEVGEVTGFSRSFIYAEKVARHLIVTKVGRRSVVTLRDLDDWVVPERRPRAPEPGAPDVKAEKAPGRSNGSSIGSEGVSI